MGPSTTERPAPGDEIHGADPERSEAEAPSSELGIFYRTIRKGLEDHGKDLAAAIAFWTFFSIFPLLLAITGAAGHVLKSEAAQAKLLQLLIDTLPGSAELVRHNVESVVQARGTLGIVGVVGLLWSASSAMGAVTRAVNRALGAKRSHPFFLSKLRYFLTTLAVSVLILLSVGVTAAVEILPRLDLAALGWLGIEPGLVDQLTAALTSVVFTFLTFSLIYKVTPYLHVQWRQVVPGALLGAAVFELGKRVFLVYLSRVANFEAIYGPLSSIIVLLLWLYVSALVLVFGAEYNIVRWRARHGKPSEAAE